MSEKTNVMTLHLDGTKKGTITIAHVEAPYGPDSEAVASVGISLKGDEDAPDWKVHLPYSQIDDVIAGLQEAKKKFG